MDTFNYCVLLVTFIALLCVQNNLTAALNNCTDVSNCTTPNETCTEGFCVCSSDYYEEADACVMKGILGSNCSGDDGCLTVNASCSIVTKNCSCDDDFYQDGNDTCNLKKVYGDDCNDNKNCKGGNGTIACIQTTDSRQRCLCVNGIYRVGSTCERLSTIVPSLTSHGIGTNNIEVRWTASNLTDYSTKFQVFWTEGSSGELDQAQNTYNIKHLNPGKEYTVYLSHLISRHGRTQTIGSANMTYSTYSLRNYDELCNATMLCDTVGSTISCHQDVSRCLCNGNTFWNGSQCYDGQGYGGDCNGQIQCDTAGNTISCDTEVSKCLCQDNTYWNGSACYDGSNLIPAFNDPTTDGTNSINVTWSATDTREYSTFFTIAWSLDRNATGSHETRVKYYKIEGLAEGKPYNVSLVRTLNKYGKNWTIAAVFKVYYTKISYGGQCKSNETCIDSNANCFGGKCLCNSHYYRDNGSSRCEGLAALTPTDVESDSPTTTSVVIRWVEPDKKAYITKYKINLDSKDFGVQNPPVVFATGNFKKLNDLTPGTFYDVYVAAESKNEERVEYASAAPLTLMTKPAVVTGIDDTKSNFTGPNITIAFDQAEGKSDHYTVNLKGDNQFDNTKSTNGNDTKITFSGVTSGNYYNITIKTIRGNNESDPFTTRRRVMVAQSDSVNEFHRSQPTSRSVFVSWKQPNSTNGALFEYSLEIYRNSSSICVFRIVFNCTDCIGNRVGDNKIKDCLIRDTVPLNRTQIASKNLLIEYNITMLLPATSYKVQAVAYTEEGRGQEIKNNRIYFQTSTEAAQTPISFSFTNKTSSSITLLWEPQQPKPGITNFKITVYERREDSEEFTMLNTTTIVDEQSIVISELSSYWEYKFSLQAYTTVQPWSPLINISNPVTTEESVPAEVENLNIKTATIENSFNKVKVQWKCPKQKDGRNGVIKSATLKFASEDTTENPTKADNIIYDNDKDCRWEEVVEVTPEYNYIFTVYIQNTFFEGKKSNTTKYIPGGPPDLSTTVVSISGGGDGKSDSETFAPVVISPQALHNGKNGRVILTGVIVSKPGSSPVRKKREMQEDHYNQLNTWKESKTDGFLKEYRATPADWIDDKKDIESMEFVIGSNKTCDNAPGDVFCNGPLPPGTTFQVRLFACTNVGCTESTKITIITQEPPNKIPLIVGAVVAAVVAVLLVLLAVWLIRRRKKNTKPAYLEADEIQESELIQKKRPIRISAFEKRVEEMHKDSNLLFSEEFEDINALSPKHSCTASETGGNKLKNRYVNILPFDNSRVKLLPTEEDDEETDYINANYIPGFRSQREYIATQGPMTGTVNDFWRMIWEQNVPIIVMLSDLMEKGKPKVDRYYPENMEPVQYGDIVVEMTNYSPLSKYVIRIFKLQLGDEVRMVRHYFLPGWQDFGANLTSDDVINFLKSVRMEIKPNNQGPICVHCSAGVGRTGTYISLDVFQQHIDEENLEKELDIFDFALKMRQNRSYMIQTEKQYIFVHDTIKEMIIRKKKEMSERDHIYQNSGQDDNVYENQAFEADVDTQDIYMNVDSATGKPTTAL